MPEIKFTIKPDGTVLEEVIKVKGRKCLDLTRQIEKSLGEVIRRQLSGDFYDEPGTAPTDRLVQKNTV